MNKKILAMVLSICLSFTLVGCASESTQNSESNVNNNSGLIKVEPKSTTNSVPDKEIEPDFDEDAVLSSLIVNEYSYSAFYGNFLYYVIEIANNSEFDADFSVNVKFYDAEDNLIGAESLSEDCIEAGYSTVMQCSVDEPWSRTEYSISASNSKYYECVQSDIQVESSPAKDKVVVSLSNIGEEAAEFVQAKVLFFNGDNCVGYDWTYFTDNDSELKPSKSISENLDCSEAFDGYKVFVTGRRSNY